MIRPLLTMAVTLLMSFGAMAFPDRPITVVVPYPTGGGTDILSRYVLARVAEDTGWRLHIENKPGFSGVIGSREVSRAKPDGHTLLMGHIAPNGINPGDFAEPRFANDWPLDAVALVAEAPLLLLAHRDSGYVSLERFMASPPRGYGSDGIGSLAHLAMAGLIGKKADSVHVPYKGGGPALQGLMGGEVPVLFSPAPVAMGQIGSGRFVVIGHTGSKPLPMLGSVPRAGSLDAPLWWGLFAPPGTQDAVRGMIAAAIDNVLRKPDVVRWLNDNGYTPRSLGPREFTEYVARERLRWSH